MPISKTRAGRPTNMKPDDMRRFNKIPPAFERNKIKPGEVRNPNGRPGRSLLEQIKAELKKIPAGTRKTRLEIVAEAYVEQMESGSFAHSKEIIDREEGKVPTRLADADGTPLKQFIGLPTEGADAP